MPNERTVIEKRLLLAQALVSGKLRTDAELGKSSYEEIVFKMTDDLVEYHYGRLFVVKSAEETGSAVSPEKEAETSCENISTNDLCKKFENDILPNFQSSVTERITPCVKTSTVKYDEKMWDDSLGDNYGTRVPVFHKYNIRNYSYNTEVVPAWKGTISYKEKACTREELLSTTNDIFNILLSPLGFDASSNLDLEEVELMAYRDLMKDPLFNLRRDIWQWKRGRWGSPEDAFWEFCNAEGFVPKFGLQMDLTKIDAKSTLVTRTPGVFNASNFKVNTRELLSNIRSDDGGEWTGVQIQEKGWHTEPRLVEYVKEVEGDGVVGIGLKIYLMDANLTDAEYGKLYAGYRYASAYSVAYVDDTSVSRKFRKGIAQIQKEGKIGYFALLPLGLDETIALCEVLGLEKRVGVKGFETNADLRKALIALREHKDSVLTCVRALQEEMAFSLV